MTKKKKYGIIFLLAFTCLCYNLPYLSSTFYPQFIDAFKISNEQAGVLLTMFGLTATPGYLFGGLLADKFSPKKLILISMFGTAALGFVMNFAQSFGVLMVCYFGFGLSTTFVQWAALMKLLREQVSGGDEGRIFGFFEFCYAIAGAVTSYGILAALGTIIEKGGSFKLATIIYAAILIIIGILVALLIKDVKENKATNEFDIKMVGKAISHPVVWLNGLIVMGIFLFGSGTTYFAAWLTGSFAVSLTLATAINIASRTFFRLIFVPIGSVLLDKLRTPKFLIITSLCIIALTAVFVLMPQNADVLVIAIVLVILIDVVSTMARPGIYTPIPEAGVPLVITGTAMGICSAVGYSTDLWFYQVCGKWIDTYGANGYRYVGALMIAGLVMVVVCSILLGRYEKKHAEESAASIKNDAAPSEA